MKYEPDIEGVGLEERASGATFRRKFQGPRPFWLAPVITGNEYDVTIESMSKRGDSGVARIQGLVVFVPGAKVGQSRRIKITKIGSGFAVAEVVEAAAAAATDKRRASDTGSLQGKTKSSDSIDE